MNVTSVIYDHLSKVLKSLYVIFNFFLAQQGWNILQSALQLFIVCLCFEQDQGSNNKEKNELALVQKFVHLEVMLCVEDPLFHF